MNFIICCKRKKKTVEEPVNGTVLEVPIDEEEEDLDPSKVMWVRSASRIQSQVIHK